MRAPTALLLAAVLLSACSGRATAPDRLVPDEVAGLYHLCTLRFTPTNAVLPVADLLQTVVSTDPPAGRPHPTLVVTSQRTYELAYTRRSDAFLQLMRGSVRYRSGSVELSVPEATSVPGELLLPAPLVLSFAATGPRLAASPTGAYAVPREAYTRAAGISGDGLQPTISGQLSLELTAGGCG